MENTVRNLMLLHECEERGVSEQFWKLIGQGNTPQFAHMVALREPSGTMGTDRAFMEGHHNHGFTEEPEWMRTAILGMAKNAGISTTGKKYVGGLGAGLGPKNPLAWVSDTHDVIESCKRQNMNAKGAVNYQAPGDIVPPQDVPLAENMVQSIVKDYLVQDPGLAAKPMAELREMVIDRHGKPARGRGALNPVKRKREPRKQIHEYGGAP